MALIQVSKAILIRRPVEEVYAYTTDYTKAFEWQDGLTLYEMVTPGPVAVGSKFRQKYKEGIDLDIVVTEIEPNKKYYSEADHKWVYTVSKVDYKPHAEGTLLMTHFSMNIKIGIINIFSPLIEPTVRKKHAASLENLKKVIESKY